MNDGNVILTLTADAISPCTDAIADSFVLNFIDFVEVEAGPDIQSCEDEPIDILGTAANYTSVNWTTSGDGSFSDDTSLQTTYTPGPIDGISPTATLTLEAVGTPPCTNQTDFLTVTFNDRPSIDIGSDIIACENEEVTFNDVIVQDFDTLQWITSGSGTLLNPTTASPTYIPGTGETGIVTFTLTVSPVAPCIGDEIVQKIIEYNASPTVNAGSDATLCEENGSYTIPDAQESNTNGIQWNAPLGDGTFVNDTSLTPTYTPGQNDYINGFVELEITGFGLQACPSVTDSMILTLTPNAIVDAGPDSFICEGETFTITGASSNTNDIFWTTTGLGTITGINTLTPTYTPATGEIGTILLTLNSNAIPPCLNEETSSMTLTIDAQPISEIDEDATICEDETYTFSGTISGDPSTTFSWSTTGSGNFVNTNTLTPTYTPSDGDATLGVVEFSLTAVSGGSCPDDVSTMSLFINQLPVVDAGVDVAICELDSYILSDATVTNSSSLTWISSGTGTFSNPNILNPTYTPSQDDIDNGSVLLTLEADADSPCIGTVSDSLTITFIDSPIVDAGPDTAICEGTYTVIGASASNDSSLLWTIVQGTGTLTNETTIAPIYTTSLGDVGVGQVILKLTVTGNAPCDLTVEDELVLDIQAEPTVDAGTDAQVCVDTSYTFLNGATSENTDTILWTHDGLGTLANPNSLTPTYTPSNGELGLVTFTLTGTPFAPCSNEVQDDFVLEIIDFGTVNAGPDVTLCETTYQLDGTGTNINTISWTTSGTGTFSSSTILNPIYSASPEDVTAGSVVLTLSAETNPPCLGNISDSIILTFEETPIVDAGQDASICEGDSYILSEANTQNTTTTLWTTNGDGVFDDPTTVNTTYNPGTNDVQNATVTLTLTGAGSPLCLDAIDTIDLTITNTPSITIPSNVISWCSDNLPLIISGVSASNFTTVEWSTDGTGTFDNNNVLNPNYNPSSQDLINGVNLSVSVANGTNCPTVSETINVIFEENVSVSAGDDGIICENDTFQITNANTTALNFTWSSSGDGTFINDTSLSPIYTPGPSDINSGSPIEITLTADNNNACPGSTSDSLLLNITREATSNAGPATDTICAGTVYLLDGIVENSISVEWTTSGDGVFGDDDNPSTTYTPGTNDIVNGLVTLSLLAVGDAPCNNLAESSIELFINGEITVFAGADAAICESDNFYQISDASITPPDFTILEWTTTGTGFFDDPNSLNPIYNPSPLDVTAGIVTLTLDVTTAGGCGIITDSLLLNITKEATSNAGPTTDVICEGDVYILNGVVDNSISVEWTTSGDGVFGDDEDPSTTYTPGTNDIVNGLVTLSLLAVGDAPCNNLAESSIELFINGEITVFAGADAAICESDNFYQISDASITPPDFTSLVWTTSGTGFFDDPNSLNPTYSPSPIDVDNGFVTLTLDVSTAAACGINTDSLLLTITKEATSNAGPDTDSICVGTIYPLNGIVENSISVEWTTSGDGVFGDDDNPNTTYTPGTNDIGNGLVTLSLLAVGDAPCNNLAVSSIELFINGEITVFAGADAAICESDNFYQISDASISPPDFTSLVWTTSGTGFFDDPNSLNPIYNPSPLDADNGVVILTLDVTTNNSCSITTDSLLLNITKEATSNAGPATDNICAGDVYALSGIVENSISVEWTTSGDGVFGDPISPITNYFPGPNDIAANFVNISLLAVGDAPCNNLAISSIDLFINEEITVFAGADATICESDNFYQISDASITPPDFISLEWTTSGTGFFNDPNSLNAIYNPSPLDVSSGFVVLTLDVNAAAACSITTDSLILEFIEEVSGTGIISGLNTVCLNTANTYTVTGLNDVDSYTWSINPPANAQIISGDGTDSVVVESSLLGFYDLTVIPSNICGPGDPVTFNIEVIEFNLELISAVGTDSQVLCETDPLVAIDYEFSAGATSATVSTLPAGVTASIAGNVLTISGTPTDNITTTQIYPYTVTTVGGSCPNTTLSGTITVEPQSGLDLTSAAGTDAQILCENTPIIDITYDLVDGATGATVTGLPAGVSLNVASGSVTISGTPTDDITTQTVYTYDIFTTGSPCSGSVTGTITVDPDDDLDLISAAGTDAQVLCETDPLVAIDYEFSAGATSATVSTLPAGVTSAIVGNVLTISGTPTDDITTQTVYNYTVTTIGTCADTSLSGTITVDPEGGLDLTSAAGTDAQILCENTPIIDITYDLVDGATGATVTGLPAGVSLNVASGSVTISGTPTDDITTQTVYTYDIFTTGSPCSGSVTGTITVDPDDDLDLISAAGTDAQVLCETDPLVAIDYEFSAGATSATVSSLPAGVTSAIVGNVLTISGTPTDDITTQTVYNYTVTTIGTCADTSLSGTITVNPDDDLDLISGVGTDSQVLCETDPLVAIDYEFSAGATSATVSTLPAGVTSAIVGNVLTISGTPTDDITTQTVYNYTVTTIGTCADTSLSGTITVNPDDDLDLISASWNGLASTL